MKIIAFGASTSSKSINKTLAAYAAHQLDGASVEVLDLNDYEIPLFSEDKEVEIGKPQLATDFLNKLASADALVISFAEHNGAYTAAYKNLLDWCSRQTREVFQNKPVVALATSPGPGGAKSVLEMACKAIPHFSGKLKANLSVPRFFDNFDLETNNFKNDDLKQQVLSAVQTLL